MAEGVPARPLSLVRRALPILILPLAFLAATAHGQSADSLPAFKSDSATRDPFRQVEAGPSPWSANPNAAAAAPKTRADSLAQADTVTERLRKRRPAVSVHLGVDFSDLDAKEAFTTSLNAFVARRVTGKPEDSLKILQNYDLVHLAFPIGLQAVLPLGAYVDLVAKTHSYWYKQTAILGVSSTSLHAGDEWYALQANLGGLGLRYYIPPSLLSVTGGLGLYAQGVLFWNLGNSEIYTPHGSAPARFDPYGSGYEFQFGVQQNLTGPWHLSGSIGLLQQDFKSDRPWTAILIDAPPAGNAHWASSSIQASLNLWYHFGVQSDSSHAQKNPAVPGANAPVPAAPPAPTAPGASTPLSAPPSRTAPAAPVPALEPTDSTRRK